MLWCSLRVVFLIVRLFILWESADVNNSHKKDSCYFFMDIVCVTSRMLRRSRNFQFVGAILTVYRYKRRSFLSFVTILRGNAFTKWFDRHLTATLQLDRCDSCCLLTVVRLLSAVTHSHPRIHDPTAKPFLFRN